MNIFYRPTDSAHLKGKKMITWSKIWFFPCFLFFTGCGGGKATDISSYTVNNESSYNLKIFTKWEGGSYDFFSTAVMPGKTAKFMEVATAPGTFHESFAHRPIYPYEEIGGICIEFYKDEKPIGRTKNFDYRISQLNSSVDAEGVNQHIFTYTISDASIAIKPYSSCALDN